MRLHHKLKAGWLQSGAASCRYNVLSRQMAQQWLLHAVHAELQVHYLLAKGADLLADFVKRLGQLRAD